MKFKKLKKFLLGGLIGAFTLSLCNYMPIIAEEASKDLSYYMALDANSEEYQKWKADNLSKNIQSSKMYTLRSSSSSSSGIQNEYINVISNGSNYSLGTIGGNPASQTDNNKKLLYGYPNFGTSYTTIRIDEKDYKFSPSSVTYTENVITASQTYDDIIVSLHFSLIYNQYSGREDVAEFSYTAENIGANNHNVGVRIMFDTMLGGNDHSPFRIPNIGDASCETDLVGNSIPEFWQSFDSLTTPTVIAQGTLKIDDASTPDRVRFTNWNMASKNFWDYSRAEGTSNGDSAVCLYWNPKSMSKGDTISCKTYYGLSSLQQDGTPPLAVALTGATRLEVLHNDSQTDSYAPNPFTITAYIQNVGDGLAKNVKAKLNIPDNMMIVDSEQDVVLGDLSVNSKMYQVSWKVWVEPSTIEIIKSYSVTISSDNTDSKTIQRNIKIPPLQANGPLKLYLKKGIMDDSSTLQNLDFKIENSSDNSLNINNYVSRYYFVDESPESDKITDLYYCGNSSTNNVPVEITYHKIPAPYKNQANAYLEFDFSEADVIINSNDYLRVLTGIHTSGWDTIITSNDFSAIDNSYNGETGFVLWTKMPIYDKSNFNKIWGAEPKDGYENAVPNLDISCIAHTLDKNNIVDMVINIKNNSCVPIELSKSLLSYYYMNDNDCNQMVNVNYVGGKINGKWISITDKLSAECDLLETKKDRANSVMQLEFDESSGILCYNESVDIHLQMYNENWSQEIFDLSNDYSYYGITDSNHIANNIIYCATYLNNTGNYAKYEYGEPIGNYKPIFSAFKLGEGDEDGNTLEDYNIFINKFSSDLNGILYNKYSLGENITNKLTFTNDNLYSILGSDIAYISGHGSRGGAIPIYANGIRPDYSFENDQQANTECEKLYSQLLTTDANIKTDYQNFGLFDSEYFYDNSYNKYYHKSSFDSNDIFSLNMKDHKNDNITENLQWIITAACSQINERNAENYGSEYPQSSSSQRWVDVLKNNKKLKGVLGYWGRGPSANDVNPDNEIIKEFLRLSTPLDDNGYGIYNIYDAWIVANEYFKIDNFIKGTSPCGLLVKDQYDKDCLYNSLISNEPVNFDKIYRYTAESKGKIFIDHEKQVVFDNAVKSISTYYNMTIEETEEILDDNYVEIDRTTYNDDGEYINEEVVEYLFEMNNSLPQLQLYAVQSCAKNSDSSVILRYNPNTDTVEEF